MKEIESSAVIGHKHTYTKSTCVHDPFKKIKIACYLRKGWFYGLSTLLGLFDAEVDLTIIHIYQPLLLDRIWHKVNF